MPAMHMATLFNADTGCAAGIGSLSLKMQANPATAHAVDVPLYPKNTLYLCLSSSCVPHNATEHAMLPDWHMLLVNLGTASRVWITTMFASLKHHAD